MFEQGISKQAKSCLELLAGQDFFKSASFYLAGGTALSIHLGHRLSFDLDFFTEREFQSNRLVSNLKPLGKVVVDQISEFTFNGQLNGVKISFFRYPYPLLKPYETYHLIPLASVPDIACMKLDAIASRGTKRDFIDLYFICRTGRDLKNLLSDFDAKYAGVQYNRMHLLKSLVYFEDAKNDPMPKMMKPVKWETVISYFKDRVPKLI